jgi:inner membrane protein
MKAEGHTGLALLLCSPIALISAFFVSELAFLLFFAFVVITVNLPDIDFKLSRTTVGEWLGIEHRGFTHTYYFAIICGIFTLAFGSGAVISPFGYILMFLSGFLGVTLHSVGDIMTPAGVKYIPNIQKTTYSLNWFNFNNIIANMGFFSIGLMTTVLIIAFVNDPKTQILLYWVGFYLVLFPIILLMAKNTEWRYESSILSKYFSLFWWFRKLT